MKLFRQPNNFNYGLSVQYVEQSLRFKRRIYSFETEAIYPLRSIKKQQSVISYHRTVQLYLKESKHGELEIFLHAILKNQEDRR